VSRLPLDGIRVLELGNYMAGPYAGTLLGDMGADVVKIEPPGEGDYTRGLGPFPPGSKDGASFLRLNRNKRSLALDLKRAEGKRAFLALVRRADVVIENFRAGTMDSLGVGYEALVTERPAVVYLSVTGFGRTGPYRDRPGLDLILQAESGIMSATGEEDRPPVKVGVPVVDMATALYGAYAVVCALRVRDRDGVGQLIDLSLLEAGVSLAIWESGVYLTTGEIPGRLGSAHRRGAVSAVLPLAEIERYVSDLAGSLAANAPLTLRTSKLAVLASLDARRAALGPGNEIVELAYLSEDFREGTTAFLEKRKPVWKGR